MATRIMVINDTQEIMALFQEILTEEGYEVILHSYTIHTLDEIKQIKPDLIILDYIFGWEKVGWQLLQRLKMNRDTAKIPMIVSTAATKEVRDIEGYLQAKGIGLLPKPFEIDDLLWSVQQALRTHEQLASTDDSLEPGGESEDWNES